MLLEKELYSSLQNLSKLLDNILKFPSISPSDKILENFLYSLERLRFEMYEQVQFYNKISCDTKINLILNEYKANFKSGVLSIYIPEKLPTLKSMSSHAHKQILLNVAKVTKPYERLFYNKFVIVIIKIFDKAKVWDVDNRTVKPIQDGLVYGGIIKDDNLFNCCYMVQGFHSDTPHIDVYVLEANKILKFINNNLPNTTK